MTPAPNPTPMARFTDLAPFISDMERRWSGRGQRFVEEAPRYRAIPDFSEVCHAE